MRSHGTLCKWNEDRGFGFITPAGGGADVFVHISAFPRDGVAPRIGEVISFESRTGPDGRTKAVSVLRPGAKAPRRPRARRKPWARAKIDWAIGVVLILGVAAYVLMPRLQTLVPVPVPVPVPVQPAAASQFQCDGRKHCSQMRSCEEAEFFIRHCPDTQMDGDNDGEPCESQWCR